MNQRQEFYPDIQTKYQQLLIHMNEKNKVTDELVKILKELCNLEVFYSNTLDKLANSVSKLLVGKDPFKDVLIIFQRILASKSEESEKMALSIKDDMIPFIEQSIDGKTQQGFRSKQRNIKQIRLKMQRKVRSLYQAETQFKRTVTEMRNTPSKKNVSSSSSLSGNKQTLSKPSLEQQLQTYKVKQAQLNDTIDLYNANIDEYMMKYSDICEDLSEIQTKRKDSLRDAVSKFMIFEMNFIKNIEYNITRYMEGLNKMNEKLIIQDRIIVGGSAQLYDERGTGVIQLAKLSNNNYINNIGKKNIQNLMPLHEKKFISIKKINEAGQLDSSKYHNLLEELFPLLDYANGQNEFNFMREICIFSLDFWMNLRGMKIGLLSGLLCHEIFNNQKMWKSYNRRLTDKIKREQNPDSSSKADHLTRLRTLLEPDISFLKQININHLISDILHQLESITQASITTKISGNSEQKIGDSEDQSEESVGIQNMDCFL